MRDYSKVSASFWTGKTGKAMRGDMQTQIVAMYLMTSPHANMIGVFTCPPIYISHETGSPLEGAMEGLKKLSERGFCTYDEETETIWVHEMARFQIGDELKASDNRVKDIQKQYENLTDGLIKQGFYEKYKDAFHLPEQKPLASPLQAPPKPEAGTGTEAGIEEEPTALVASKLPTCPQQEIISLYFEILPELPQPRIWEGQRQKNLSARWRWVASDLKKRGKPSEPEDCLDFFRRLFGYVSKSDFLMGKTGSWTASLDWIVESGNFAKIVQGNYENKAAA